MTIAPHRLALAVAGLMLLSVNAFAQSGGGAGGGGAGGAGGGPAGSSGAAPGTNSLGTAQSSGGGGPGGSAATGTGNPATDAQDKAVDKKVKSICKGC